VDESLLTGESTAVPKRLGDTVMGGTTCVSGGCLMRATKVGCDTALGQICQLVQEAQASKAGVQRVADRVARVFVPSVICLSLATFLVWTFLIFSGLVSMPRLEHGGAAMDMEMDDGPMGKGSMHAEAAEVQGSLKLLFAMKFGMAVLMIACPCAMGLATPMAVMVATGVAAKRGCLVKSAAALESAARLGAVVLDKTGTITEGEPSVQAAACAAGALEALLGGWQLRRREQQPQKLPGLSEAGAVALEAVGAAEAATAAPDVQALFWWLLATLESASDHPIAKSILSAAQRTQGLPPVVAPHNFESFSGRGVQCVLEQLGGATARVGNLRFYEEAAKARGTAETPEAAELLAWVKRLQEQGHTVVLLHVDAQPLGAVALRDPIRADARALVDFLSTDLGLEVWLCSGDNAATAQCVAHEVGIRHIVAEALPSTKSEQVRALQRTGRSTGRQRVCFIGDGINDSPALAAADVGIALGVGAQVAVEAADVALVRSELKDCIAFLTLSRATFRTILLNFFWAFCFNFVCLPMAAGVLYPTVHIPPLAAGIGMATSSCLVVLSSLQLRRFGPSQAREQEASETAPLMASGGAELELPTPQAIGAPAEDWLQAAEKL